MRKETPGSRMPLKCSTHTKCTKYMKCLLYIHMMLMYIQRSYQIHMCVVYFPGAPERDVSPTGA